MFIHHDPASSPAARQRFEYVVDAAGVSKESLLPAEVEVLHRLRFDLCAVARAAEI